MTSGDRGTSVVVGGESGGVGGRLEEMLLPSPGYGTILSVQIWSEEVVSLGNRLVLRRAAEWRCKQLGQSHLSPEMGWKELEFQWHLLLLRLGEFLIWNVWRQQSHRCRAAEEGSMILHR
jgi:hypothetical protein